MADLAIVLAMMACVAIGFAVTAREALGRERELREAREQAHEAEELALTEAKEKAERELEHHRRLLDCHVDALIAATTEGRASRPVRVMCLRRLALVDEPPAPERVLGDHGVGDSVAGALAFVARALRSKRYAGSRTAQRRGATGKRSALGPDRARRAMTPAGSAAPCGSRAV